MTVIFVCNFEYEPSIEVSRSPTLTDEHIFNRISL